MKASLIFIITLYQRAIRPYLGLRCRYVPSCSDYAKEAVKSDGFLIGFWKGLIRIGRCAPWGGSGYDPYHSNSL